MKITKIALLTVTFQQIYDTCLGFEDDRYMFVRKYNDIVAATEEYNDCCIVNPVLIEAFNKQFNSVFCELLALQADLRSRALI